MAIGPVILNGTISRATDYSTLKHNEDHKGMVDQGNFQTQFNKKIETKLHRVSQADDIENNQGKYDAKEKSQGNYTGDGGRKRKKTEQIKEQVVEKGRNNHFDIQI